MDLSWKYDPRHRPAAPVVPVTLASFPIQLVVDTGFGGGVLVPFPLFDTVGLMSALTPDAHHVVMPDSRRLRLYTARSEVRIGTGAMSVEVHASPSIDRRLAGRAFLRSFVATLDGSMEQLKLRGPMASRPQS